MAPFKHFISATSDYHTLVFPGESTKQSDRDTSKLVNMHLELHPLTLLALNLDLNLGG